MLRRLLRKLRVLQDAVKLAQQLRPVWPSQSRGKAFTAAQAASISAALRQYEKERKQRVLPITVRANAMGVALNIALAPVGSPHQNHGCRMFRLQKFNI